MTPRPDSSNPVLASSPPAPVAINKSSVGLKETLEQLESCLESPVVPGELPEWVGSLSQACEPAKNALRREIREVHSEQFARLSKEDPNQLNRVTQMREEDKVLQEQAEQFFSTVERMCERAPAAEPQERKADEGVSTIVDTGLALIIRIRKQERALATWFSEAFQRDTGTAD